MTDTVIVSGGMIQKDFALDFLKKLQRENKDQKLQLVAADRGLDFFRETGWCRILQTEILTAYLRRERHTLTALLEPEL